MLTRLAEVLRIDIEEITSAGDGGEDGQYAYPAAPLIEQAMVRYGILGTPASTGEPGRRWGTCARWPAPPTRATRRPATTPRVASCRS